MEIITTLIIGLIFTILIFLIVLIFSTLALLFGIKFKIALKFFSWLCLLPTIVIVLGATIGRMFVNVKSVEIKLKNLPPAFNEYKIVHISDLHLRSFKKRKSQLNKIVDKINALEPDIVVYTGDLVTLSAQELPGFDKILSKIQTKNGIYACLGNHDYMMYNRDLTEEEKVLELEQLKKFYKDIGWNLLCDEHIDIVHPTDSTAALTIIGVENIYEHHRLQTVGNLDKALEGAKGQFKILLSHDPSTWRREIPIRGDIDLCLSGHTHNMQFSFFGLHPARIVFKENKGLYEQDGKYLYVNIGLGETIIPIRFAANKEITLLTLRRE